MTIKQAINDLLKSDKFLEDSRTDAKLRVFKQRFNEGGIKSGAALNLLISYGYSIDIKKGIKAKAK